MTHSVLEDRPTRDQPTAQWQEAEQPEDRGPRRSPWRQRLVDLERGLVLGLRTDGALHALLFGTATTVVAGLVLGLSLAHWIAVVLAITVVWVAGLLHQAVKMLRQLVADERDDAAQGMVRLTAVALNVAVAGGTITIALVVLDHLQPLLDR